MDAAAIGAGRAVSAKLDGVSLRPPGRGRGWAGSSSRSRTKAADDVQPETELVRRLTGLVQKLRQGRRQPLFQPRGQLGRARRAARLPALDQVGARDDADDFLVLDDRHLAQVRFHHDGAQLFERVVRRRPTAGLFISVLIESLAELVVERAIDLAARQHAHQPAAPDDRKPLVPVTVHHLRRLGHGGVRLDRVHAERHERADRERRPDRLLEQLDQFGFALAQIQVADQRGGRLFVPAAAKGLGDLGHVDRAVLRARHHLDVVVHLDQDKERGRIVQIANLVRQGGDLFGIRVRAYGGDRDRVPFDVDHLDPLEEFLVQGVLRGGQRMAEEIVDDLQVGAGVEQRRRGPQIARRRGAIRQSAGVLIDAEQQERGLDRGERQLFIAQRLDEKSGRRAGRARGKSPAAFQLPGQRVVVDDVEDGILPDPARRRRGLGIDQQDVLHVPAGEILLARQRERLAVERTKLAHVAIETARQYGDRFGVESSGAEERGHRIKVGVLVREDGVHRGGIITQIAGTQHPAASRGWGPDDAAGAR